MGLTLGKAYGSDSRRRKSGAKNEALQCWKTLNHPFIAADQDLTESLDKFARKNGLEEVVREMHARIFVVQDISNVREEPIVRE